MNHPPRVDATTAGTGEEELLADLADDFAGRHRRGERPSVEEYAAQHPGLGGQIRDLFPALLMMEQQCEVDPALAGAKPEVNQAGTTIGRYKLLEQIGGGGMGVVYMAEQVLPVRRKVALKIVKPGMDSAQVIARFEAERQALTMMEHPNIAKVLDAGTTDAGRPYFVMELVKGIPITDYCDRERLTTRHRLELFIHVCQAVQHAHQKGVIHRDLKPGNVLVTMHDDRPVPKIIDFGIAKAAGQELTERTLFTCYAQILGTPLYMSPEQAQVSGIDVDTRSDVYSLGVLLYELLTGTTPFDKRRFREAAYDEMRRIIREEDPPAPSTRLSTMGDRLTAVSADRHTEPRKLGQLVRGELDWIVMKCLEKDRNRRYETAKDFAADVQRYLRNEPVQARSVSAAYRLRKFARRHKGAFAVVLTAAVGAVLLIAMLVISNLWISREVAKKDQALKDKEAALTAATASEQQAKAEEALANTARQEADENLKDARAAAQQMLTQVADRLAGVPRMEYVRRKLLEDASKFYQKLLQRKGDDPAIFSDAAWAHRHLAAIQFRLGARAEAEGTFRKAFAMFDEMETRSLLDAHARRAVAESHMQFARLLGELAKTDEQEQHLRRALRMAEELSKQFPGDVHNADVLVAANVNFVTQVRCPPEQEEEVLYRSLLLARSPYLLAYTQFCRGRLRMSQARWGEARQDFLKSVENFEAVAVLEPSNSSRRDVAVTLLHLGEALAADGRPSQADASFGRALPILEALASEYVGIELHVSDLALGHRMYADLLRKLNRLDEARTEYRRATDLCEKLAADSTAVPAYRLELQSLHRNLDEIPNEKK